MLIRALRSHHRLTLLALLAATATFPSAAFGGPINSDVAFTPRKGGGVFRLQYGYREADARGNVQHVNASSVAGTLVYGVTQDFALFLTVPYVNRQVDRYLPRLGRVESAHDGIGDVTFLAKYRFWQKDVRVRETMRAAVIGGLNVRSGDSDFSSDSYDPIIGTVFTWRRNRHLVDADLIYQLNTGSGQNRHDTLRYDLAYSYQFAPVVYDPNDNYEWNAVAELNGRYTADGSHEVFLAPGLQYVREQWTFEASIQLPVVQNTASLAPETDYRVVFGVTYRW